MNLQELSFRYFTLGHPLIISIFLLVKLCPQKLDIGLQLSSLNQPSLLNTLVLKSKRIIISIGFR